MTKEENKPFLEVEGIGSFYYKVINDVPYMVTMNSFTEYAHGLIAEIPEELLIKKLDSEAEFEEAFKKIELNMCIFEPEDNSILVLKTEQKIIINEN